MNNNIPNGGEVITRDLDGNIVRFLVMQNEHGITGTHETKGVIEHQPEQPPSFLERLFGGRRK
jgi:hypothetical protein